MSRERFVRGTERGAKKLHADLVKQGRENVRINIEESHGKTVWVVSCERGYVPPKTLERRDTRAWDRDELGLLEYLEED